MGVPQAFSVGTLSTTKWIRWDGREFSSHRLSHVYRYCGVVSIVVQVAGQWLHVCL